MTNDYGTRLNQATADVLRGELAALEWTLADLAAASGVPKVSVQRYLKGTRNIDVEILARLAHALGTDAADVLAGAMRRLDQPAPARPGAEPDQTTPRAI